MNPKNSAIFIVTFLAAIPSLSDAACSKAQVCNDYGMDCQVQDICDNSLDLPSVEIAPLAPLPSTELKPLPSVNLPPIGAAQCQYMQVNGQWKNICN